MTIPKPRRAASEKIAEVLAAASELGELAKANNCKTVEQAEQLLLDDFLAFASG